MANTLTSFLVNIGLDFDTKGAKQAESSLNSIKSTALQAGAAVAGAFGTKAVTMDVANRVRNYSLLAEQIGSTAKSVDALDRVYQRATGKGAGEMIGQLEQLKRLQSGLAVGDVDWISKVARAGIDPSAIMGMSDPVDVMRDIVRQLDGMSTNARVNAISAIGLDPATINLAEDGLKEYDKQFQKALKRNTFSTQLEKDSDMFAKNWFDMWDNVQGITTRAGSQIIPEVNKITGSVNDFFEANRDVINSGADKVFGEIAKNLDLVAIAAVALTASSIGTVLATMAKHIPIIGGTAGKLAMVAKSMGAIGLAYGAASYAARKVDQIGQGSEWYRESDKQLTKFIYDATGFDVSRGGVYEGSERGETGGKVTSKYAVDPSVSGYSKYDKTVIPPSEISSTSTEVSSGKSLSNRSGGVGDGPSKTITKQPIINNFIVEGSTLKQVFKTLMEEEDRQTVKDFVTNSY